MSARDGGHAVSGVPVKSFGVPVILREPPDNYINEIGKPADAATRG